MKETELTVGKALATVWDAFILSPMGISSNLAHVGLHSYSGRSAFQGWNGTGDFYGRTQIQLLREDGTRFMWTVAILFEQGEYEGKYWQQGGPYAYMSVMPIAEEAYVGLYSIGSAELLSNPFKIADLDSLAESLIPISEKCFEDLEFIYWHNLFDALLDLTQKRTDGHEQWESSPLRSN